MSILIKDMEMPTSCGVCKFFAWKRGVGKHCAIDDVITFHATLDGVDVRYVRNGDCPLFPVPDHGRLIDADAFYKSFKRWLVKFYGAYEKDKKDERIAALLELDLAVRATLEDASTIIPADHIGDATKMVTDKEGEG